MPASHELKDVYSATYSAGAARTDTTGFESDDRMLQGLAALLLNKYLKHGNRVLEFGAGTGRFASMLSINGINVDGVELGNNARLEAKIRYQLNFKADLSELPSDSYDWIVGIEVLEHLLKPSLTLEMLRTKVAPNGGIFLTTPNASGLAARLHGTAWREAKNPFHLTLYTPRGIKRLLLRSGYDRVGTISLSPLGNVSAGRWCLHRSLQALGLYGGLRVIAHRPAGLLRKE